MKYGKWLGVGVTVLGLLASASVTLQAQPVIVKVAKECRPLLKKAQHHELLANKLKARGFKEQAEKQNVLYRFKIAEFYSCQDEHKSEVKPSVNPFKRKGK